MRMRNITPKTSTKQTLKYFRDAGPNDSVNLKTKKGFIYLVGGILSKLEGDRHSVLIDGRWVKV